MSDEISNEVLDMAGSATSATGEQGDTLQGSNVQPVENNTTEVKTTRSRGRNSKKSKPETVEDIQDNTTGEKSDTSQNTNTQPSQDIQDNTTDENTTKKKGKKQKGVKRIQVSVYLLPETYDTLLAMSSTTHESVSDMLAKSADNLAEKNRAKAQKIKELLQGIKLEY